MCVVYFKRAVCLYYISSMNPFKCFKSGPFPMALSGKKKKTKRNRVHGAYGFCSHILIYTNDRHIIWYGHLKNISKVHS